MKNAIYGIVFIVAFVGLCYISATENGHTINEPSTTWVVQK